MVISQSAGQSEDNLPGTTNVLDSPEAQLEAEREKSRQLSQSLKQLQQSTASLLNACESAQEGVSLRLLREINRMRDEYLEMCREVEQGEEQLVEILERRVKRLQKEKIELENALECEQERIVNRLQRQMDELRLALEPISPIKKGGEAKGAATTISSLPNSPANATSDAINHAVAQYVEREAELHRQISKLQEENQNLILENLRLKHRLRRQSFEGAAILSDSSSSPPSLKGTQSRGSISELRRSSIYVPSDSE